MNFNIETHLHLKQSITLIELRQQAQLIVELGFLALSKDSAGIPLGPFHVGNLIH